MTLLREQLTYVATPDGQVLKDRMAQQGPRLFQGLTAQFYRINHLSEYNDKAEERAEVLNSGQRLLGKTLLDLAARRTIANSQLSATQQLADNMNGVAFTQGDPAERSTAKTGNHVDFSVTATAHSITLSPEDAGALRVPKDDQRAVLVEQSLNFTYEGTEYPSSAYMLIFPEGSNKFTRVGITRDQKDDFDRGYEIEFPLNTTQHEKIIKISKAPSQV